MARANTSVLERAAGDGELLLKLGIDMAQSTVAKYNGAGSPATGPDLEDLLPQPGSSRWFCAFCRRSVSGSSMRSCLDQDRRRILSAAVTSHPAAEWVARQMAEALPWQETPQYLLRDRDAVYGHVVRHRLAAMGIGGRPITARRLGKTDISNAPSARFRRECIN
jgi:hypothetical protein